MTPHALTALGIYAAVCSLWCVVCVVTQAKSQGHVNLGEVTLAVGACLALPLLITYYVLGFVYRQVERAMGITIWKKKT